MKNYKAIDYETVNYFFDFHIRKFIFLFINII